MTGRWVAVLDCGRPGGHRERARAMNVPKPPPVPEGQGSLFDDVEAS